MFACVERILHAITASEVLGLGVRKWMTRVKKVRPELPTSEGVAESFCVGIPGAEAVAGT